jgi:hypothetical protein
MPKQKKSQNKSKRGPKKSRIQPTGQIPKARVVSKTRLVRQPKMAHAHSVCSMTDPFCVHAKGATRPDGGPPTLPYQIRFAIQVPALSTNGAARYVFIPGVTYAYAAGTALAGSPTTWTMAAAWTATGGPANPISTYGKEVRIVSFGIIIRSMMSATNAKGMVIVSTDSAPTVSQAPQQGSLQSAESQVITLAAGMEHAWISKPLSDSAHLFRPVSAFTSTMTDFDWSSLVVEVVGGDVTSAIPYLVAEYVCNVEFTMGTGDTTNGLATLQKPPAPANSVALAATKRVQASTSSFIQGGISSVAATVEKYAKDALTDVLSDGLALLGI